MAMAAAIISIAATATSAIIGGISAIKQGQQQASMYRSQAKSVEMQGQMKNLQARQEAAEMQTEALRMRAKQFAQAAGQGYTLDSESFLGIVAASASQAEKDRQQVLRNGRLALAEAQGQASYYRSAASTAEKNGWWTGMTSLLTGFAQTGMQMQKAGWFEGNKGSGLGTTYSGSQSFGTTRATGTSNMSGSIGFAAR